MKKVYPDAKSALAGSLKDGMMVMAGGFGLCGMPATLIEAHPRLRREEPHLRVEQCRHRRRRPRPAARDAPDQEDDRLLCGREQAVRAAVSRRRARDRVQPAGHAGRAHARGGAGIPAFFTKTGVGTDIAKGKEERVFNGERYIMETGLVADLRAGACLEGRHRRQPRLPQDRAELQSHDGDRRRASPSRRSSIWSSRASSTATTSIRRASMFSASSTPPPKSGSSSAPCASA